MGRLSKATWVYVIAVVVTAAVLIARGPLSSIDWPMLAVLAILFLVCESSSAPSGPRQFTWSASYAATLASVVLLGPVGAAIVGTAAALRLRRGLLVVQRLFNGGMYALSAYAAGSAFVALGGRAGIPDKSSFPQIIGPFGGRAGPLDR